MNKELIIQLFESKDSSRKRILNEAFKDVIHMKASRKFIARWINRELARDDLISEEDVKYCRHYFKNKGRSISIPEIPKTFIPTKAAKQLNVETDEVGWSDPDDVDYQNQKYKSKFSN